MVVEYNYSSIGLDVNFQNLSEDVPSSYSYEWDFGDGNKSTEVNPAHTFGRAGFYRTSLSVLNEAKVVVGKTSQTLAVTDRVKTTLSNSIYVLINTYIPKSIFGLVPMDIKRQFIQKWQLYMQPLVNHCVPLEEYSNELYYEALENQLIMEMAAYDYMVLEVSNMLKATSQVIKENNSITPEELDALACKMAGGVYQGSSTSGSSSSSSVPSGSVKKIKTGPTEVEYNNDYEQESDIASNVLKAMQPGGIIDLIRQNLCMLAERLDIYLPICDPKNKVVIPRVVNRRIKGPLMGPDPFEIVKK